MEHENKATEPQINQTEQIKKDEEVKKITCGLIMPISAMESYSEQHWQEVKQIITESLADDFYSISLVSDANDVGVIHNRIVKNLYYTNIVVCDVSGKNPNVMFELGLRLAFDKPTIIIKDDKTNYSFDTAPIEHLQYPADLRYSNIIEFKKVLKEKVKATYENSLKPENKTFLDHFGEFKVAELKENSITSNEFIINSLNKINETLSNIEKRADNSYENRVKRLRSLHNTDAIKFHNTKNIELDEILGAIRSIIEVDKKN